MGMKCNNFLSLLFNLGVSNFLKYTIYYQRFNLLFLSKQDGVGPLITNPPPTSFITLPKNILKTKKNHMLQVTCDM